MTKYYSLFFLYPTHFTSISVLAILSFKPLVHFFNNLTANKNTRKFWEKKKKNRVEWRSAKTVWWKVLFPPASWSLCLHGLLSPSPVSALFYLFSSSGWEGVCVFKFTFCCSSRPETSAFRFFWIRKALSSCEGSCRQNEGADSFQR